MQIAVTVANPGPHWSVFLTPAIACAATIIAWLSLRNTRAVARQKATLDLILQEEFAQHYRDTAAKFSNLRQTRTMDHLNNPVEGDKADRRALIDHVNHYEIVALGIREDILDARIYRAWMEGAFVRDWNAAADWIQRERWKLAKNGRWEYRASIYANFQELACRWSPDAIRLSAIYAPPPKDAAGPGDEPLPHPIDIITPKN